ncbi:MAG: CBS domain-containing protein, partial [Desulfobacterales bacterium]|nr:CBS domain-containing protein [Desulfobacterales bacterium]
GLGNLDRLFEAKEVRRRTLLVAIEDDELLAQAVAEAERVMDGFDRPDSGLLLVLPVTQVKGLKKVMQKPPQVVLPPAVLPNWVVLRDTPVEEVIAVMNLKPTIVSLDMPLDEIAQAMLTHPRVHVACVVADDGRLVGLIHLRALADDIFFHIMPEEFLSEITDLDEAMEFANRSHMRTAADAMQDPVWVKQGETVKHAFKRMHEYDLAGLPVVNDLYHVVGYINLLELLAICCMNKENEVSSEDGAQ